MVLVIDCGSLGVETVLDPVPCETEDPEDEASPPDWEPGALEDADPEFGIDPEAPPAFDSDALPCEPEVGDEFDPAEPIEEPTDEPVDPTEDPTDVPLPELEPLGPGNVGNWGGGHFFNSSKVIIHTFFAHLTRLRRYLECKEVF